MFGDWVVDVVTPLGKWGLGTDGWVVDVVTPLVNGGWLVGWGTDGWVVDVVTQLAVAIARSR